jgi:RNA polymerase sigma factor for flagellar operon FliA
MEINHTPRSLKEQAAIVANYSPLVKLMAAKIANKLPKNIDRDDLISAGTIGLMDAISKFDPKKCPHFRFYAEMRIKGAIFDEVRSQDWVPRSARDKVKFVDKAREDLEQELGRLPTDEEICLKLEMPMQQLRKIQTRIKSLNVVSLNNHMVMSNGNTGAAIIDSIAASSSDTHLKHINNKQVKIKLNEQIDQLPFIQRLVFSFYYYEDLNLEDIGILLSVTESRISQIHTRAIRRITAHMRHYFPLDELDHDHDS